MFSLIKTLSDKSYEKRGSQMELPCCLSMLLD